jgi:MFS superfamily sulfate permease-like transporter
MLPRFELIPRMLVDAITLACVAYVITISMAQLFAKKHRYRIAPNQVRVRW